MSASEPDTTASPAAPHLGVAGIILAAGASRRLGQPKQLLQLASRPLLQHVMDSAEQSVLDDVVVVLGANAERIQPALEPRRARFVLNERYSQGQSTSIHTGLAALPASIDAALIILGDSFGLSPDLINRLVSKYRAGRPTIVAPQFTDGMGNPVLFDRSIWPDLFAIEGDIGARELLRARQCEIATVVVNSQRLPDIDTWEAYIALRKQVASA